MLEQTSSLTLVTEHPQAKSSPPECLAASRSQLPRSAQQWLPRGAVWLMVPLAGDPLRTRVLLIVRSASTKPARRTLLEEGADRLDVIVSSEAEDLGAVLQGH